MAKAKQHPAAFINSIAEEGTKDEAVQWLQTTWNELMNLQLALAKLGFSKAQVNKMKAEGSLGKVF